MGNRSFTILFSLYIIFGIYLYYWMEFVDELFVAFIAIYACMKMSLRLIPKSKPMLIWLGIAFFYLIYSLVIKSNIRVAILDDFIMQTKPYMALFGMLCLRPRLTDENRRVLIVICIIGALTIPPIYAASPHIEGGYIAYGHLLCGMSLAADATVTGYAIFLLSKRESIATKLTSIGVIMLGLLAPTTKYIGALLMSIYIIIFLKRPLRLNLQLLISVPLIFSLVVYLNREDFDMYITNGVDDEVARAMLYEKLPDVLNDNIPFGSGFATYASSNSARWYSPLYERYGLDEVWGLSKEEATFVSDTYYPVMAQYGYAGILLFILLIIWILRKGRAVYAITHDMKRYKTVVMIVLFILIENIAGSIFIKESGVMAMILLALALDSDSFMDEYPEIEDEDEDKEEIEDNEYLVD